MKAVRLGSRTYKTKPYKALAAAVVVQALADFFSTDPVVRWDAALWLLSPTARVFVDSAGLEADPLNLLRQPELSILVRKNLSVYHRQVAGQKERI